MINSLGFLNASGVEEMTLIIVTVASKDSEADNDNHNTNYQLLQNGAVKWTFRATTFNNVLARNEVIVALAQKMGECTGLLGVSLEVIISVSPGDTDPSTGCDELGAVAVVAADELL